eukprot:gene8703-17984_t
MPGLSFLGKKSWHTSNLNNVEKVWIAEKKADDEKKKLDELKKQITEERQILELRLLQVSSGQVVKSVDTTLDWMYEGPSGQAEQSTEEYLLGKIYKPKDNEKTDLHKIEKDPGSLWLNKISSKNDTFTRLHEDPLLLIKQNEVNARKDVLNNPVKMARIQHQIAADLEKINKEKQLKKAMKKDKKAKKRKDRDHDRDRNRDRSRSISRSRSGSINGDDKRRRTNKRSRRGSRSRSDSRDRDRGGDSSNREDFDGRTERDRHYRGDRDREVDVGKSSRRRNEDDDNGDANRNRHDHKLRSRSRSMSRSMSQDRRRETKDGDQQTKKYGLIKSGNSNDNGGGDKKYVQGSSDLGPNVELLNKKIEQKKLEEAKKYQRPSTKQNISEEEKLRRIKEMENDAKVHDELRLQQLRSHKTKQDQESKITSLEKEGGSSTDVKFLTDIRVGVYNSGETTMEDRLKRNRHYQQKGTDLDTSGFMKK